ncbi:MAG TPA: response regulator, partial [Chloroflexota bacterium]
MNPVPLGTFVLRITTLDWVVNERGDAGCAVGRIMVVDDDVRVRTTIAAVLTREGYEVCQAADGLEADQRVGDFLPDVVILDIVMPRLSGSERLKRWRARNLDIGVIVLTAYGDEESATASLEAGADDHIAKPFRLREFVARV